jgi:putative hydrolase of the HAD superfamily
MVDYPQYKGSMAFWDELSPMPGVMETMPILHRNFTCIVASNAGDSNAELMKRAFERIELDKYFHGFITSKELGVVKPNASFFQGILDKYGFSTYETVMIGNDYEKDISGAKNAGLKTILITANNGVFQNADRVVPSFDKLANIFDIPTV